MCFSKEVLEAADAHHWVNQFLVGGRQMAVKADEDVTFENLKEEKQECRPNIFLLSFTTHHGNERRRSCSVHF